MAGQLVAGEQQLAECQAAFMDGNHLQRALHTVAETHLRPGADVQALRAGPVAADRDRARTQLVQRALHRPRVQGVRQALGRDTQHGRPVELRRPALLAGPDDGAADELCGGRAPRRTADLLGRSAAGDPQSGVQGGSGLALTGALHRRARAELHHHERRHQHDRSDRRPEACGVPRQLRCRQPPLRSAPPQQQPEDGQRTTGDPRSEHRTADHHREGGRTRRHRGRGPALRHGYARRADSETQQDETGDTAPLARIAGSAARLSQGLGRPDACGTRAAEQGGQSRRADRQPCREQGSHEQPAGCGQFEPGGQRATGAQEVEQPEEGRYGGERAQQRGTYRHPQHLAPHEGAQLPGRGPHRTQQGKLGGSLAQRLRHQGGDHEEGDQDDGGRDGAEQFQRARPGRGSRQPLGEAPAVAGEHPQGPHIVLRPVRSAHIAGARLVESGTRPLVQLGPTDAGFGQQPDGVDGPRVAGERAGLCLREVHGALALCDAHDLVRPRGAVCAQVDPLARGASLVRRDDDLAVPDRCASLQKLVRGQPGHVPRAPDQEPAARGQGYGHIGHGRPYAVHVPQHIERRGRHPYPLGQRGRRRLGLGTPRLRRIAGGLVTGHHDRRAGVPLHACVPQRGRRDREREAAEQGGGQQQGCRDRPPGPAVGTVGPGGEQASMAAHDRLRCPDRFHGPLPGALPNSRSTAHT